MRRVTYSLGMTLDGYIVGPDGRFDWADPGPDVFALATDEVRGLGVHLLGRHLYEDMRYWETADPAGFGDAEKAFADLWNGLPKVVFSTTLSSVEGSYSLATLGLADEVARLRAEPGEGSIGIGGATLAAAAADLGLIDEYLIRVFPVLVGGGTPFFAHHARHVDLELLETRTFDTQIVYLRYGVKR